MYVPNGLVGDWQASDADFLKTFTLPSSDQKLETLREKHPFPRESRIHFDEKSHTYTIDGSILVQKSVTKLIHQFTHDFDPQAVVAEMRDRNSWETKKLEFLKADGQPMSTEEILAKWSLNGEVQRSRGTLVHYHIEQFLNGAQVEEPWSPEFQQFQQLFCGIKEEFKIYRTEISLFHCGLRIAGQADCLCLDRNGDVVIWDWKRSKKIEFDAQKQMKEPLAHLPDCNFYTYALQLNIYRHILVSEYGMQVSRMFLGVVHPLLSAPQVIELPVLQAEVALIVEHEGNRAPVPGADASFPTS